MSERKQVVLTGRQGELSREERSQIEGAINMPKGLHKSSVGRSIVLGAEDRLLLLGPQTIPLGSTITIRAGGRMMVL